MAAIAKPEKKAAEGEQRSLSQILASLSDELARAAEEGHVVEAAFCEVAARVDMTAADVMGLQKLDAVLQHIEALRDFTAALAASADGEISTGHAFERILLGAVRARLQGREQTETTETDWEVL
jgi:hypothetical protein